jgi:hypothetical protein
VKPHRDFLLTVPRLYATIIAGAIGTAGLLLVVTDPAVTPSLKIAYQTADPWVWGISFMVSAGWFGVFRKRRAAAAPMAFVMTAWAAMLAWASVTSGAASPTAWIWGACIAALLTAGIARGDL